MESKRIKLETEAAEALLGIRESDTRPLVTHSLVLCENLTVQTRVLNPLYANLIVEHYDNLDILSLEEIYTFLHDLNPVDVYRHTSHSKATGQVLNKRVLEILNYGKVNNIAVPALQSRSKCKLEIAFDATISRMVYLKRKLIGFTRVNDGVPKYAVITGVPAVDQELRKIGYQTSSDKLMQCMANLLTKYGETVTVTRPYGHELFPMNQFSLIEQTFKRSGMTLSETQLDKISMEKRSKVCGLLFQLNM